MYALGMYALGMYASGMYAAESTNLEGNRQYLVIVLDEVLSFAASRHHHSTQVRQHHLIMLNQDSLAGKARVSGCRLHLHIMLENVIRELQPTEVTTSQTHYVVS